MRRSSLVFISLLLASCSGGSQPPPGKACLMNSECASPLVCTFGKCHSACAEARDCPTGQLCVKGPTGNVCQLPAESRCTTGAECAAPLVCGADGMCRTDCSADSRCPTPSQKCVASRICAEPEELDSSGNQLRNARPADGGVPADAAPPADGAPDLGPGSCTDRVQNGSETDVDCGGSCPACPITKSCKAATDCASGQCIGGKCLECAPGTTRCAAKRQSSCMGGLWVAASEDCASGCDGATSACRVCAPATCKSMKVIFHGAVDGMPDAQLAVDEGSKVYRTSSDADPMIGQKNVLVGNFTDDRKQYTSDNTACGLPDYGKRANAYHLAPLDSLAVASSWYGSAEDFASVKTCQSCPNFGCDNYISTPKRIDRIETVATSGDLTCRVCLYGGSPPSEANLIRCLGPNSSVSMEIDPMKPPLVLQLDDGKRCGAY